MLWKERCHSAGIDNEIPALSVHIERKQQEIAEKPHRKISRRAGARLLSR
jgi:hypothetical protein